jgi:archaellum component FlaD/FlaE
MREESAEKLLKYVTDMAGKYENDEERIISDLEAKDTKLSNAIEKIYSEEISERYCTECKEYKFYDQQRDEFYCPKHR